MKKIVAVRFAKNFAALLFTIAAIDVFVLCFALAQVAEGRPGEWNGFWRYQAEQVIKIIHRG